MHRSYFAASIIALCASPRIFHSPPDDAGFRGGAVVPTIEERLAELAVYFTSEDCQAIKHPSPNRTPLPGFETDDKGTFSLEEQLALAQKRKAESPEARAENAAKQEAELEKLQAECEQLRWKILALDRENEDREKERPLLEAALAAQLKENDETSAKIEAAKREGNELQFKIERIKAEGTKNTRNLWLLHRLAFSQGRLTTPAPPIDEALADPESYNARLGALLDAVAPLPEALRIQG